MTRSTYVLAFLFFAALGCCARSLYTHHDGWALAFFGAACIVASIYRWERSNKRAMCDVCDKRTWVYRATVCGIETLVCEQCSSN